MRRMIKTVRPLSTSDKQDTLINVLYSVRLFDTTSLLK